jgi:hypothetical protein
MIVKLFAEKVSPALNDEAARKSALGIWKEAFLHDRFLRVEAKLREDDKTREEREARWLEENAKEQKVHAEARSDSIMKYFSERVSPGIHDVAAKKEGFGTWKEQFMQDRYAKQEELRIQEMEARESRMREEERKERKVHAKTRSDMIIKYFAENSSFRRIYAVAEKKEGFGVWKEDFLKETFAKREGNLLNKSTIQQTEQARQLEQERREREIHTKTRSDMLIKYFSEKVAPGVHDVAMKKEAFGVWKENWLHASELMKRERDANERKLHSKTRSDMIMKYFSEKAAPAIHDAACVKEGFGIWKEQSMHERYLKRENLFRTEMMAGMTGEMEEIKAREARQREEDALERKIHAEARSALVCEYFAKGLEERLNNFCSPLWYSKTFNINRDDPKLIYDI